MNSKLCTSCKITKSTDEFYKKVYDNGTVGFRAACIPCGKAIRSAWRTVNKDRQIETSKRYNKEHAVEIRGRKLLKYWPELDWTQAIERFDVIEAEQNYTCKLCSRPETRKYKNGTQARLTVDHCRKTGKVRGLLCNKCNRGLGLLKECIDTVTRSLEYLKKHAA